MVSRILSRRLPGELAGRAGEEADIVDGPWDVEAGRQPDRFAGLQGLPLRQLLGSRLEQVGPGEQGSRAFPRVALDHGPYAALAADTAASTSAATAPGYCSTTAEVAG